MDNMLVESRGVVLSEQNAAITALLVTWRGGDNDALAALTPLVYDNLRRIASPGLGCVQQK
jgi:hypothetical protein